MGYDDYLDSLPYGIALSQRAFDRNRKAWQLRQLGMTLRAIGKVLDISPERVRQITRKYDPKRLSPVELWLNRDPQFRWDCDTLKGARGRKNPPTRPKVRAALAQLATHRF